TDWRSGLAELLARHPVAGWDLSACGSGGRVSWWPSPRARPRLSPTPGSLTGVTIGPLPSPPQETRSPSASRIDGLGPTHISVSPPQALSLSTGGRVGQ